VRVLLFFEINGPENICLEISNDTRVLSRY
jgi:hypothetical protein